MTNYQDIIEKYKNIISIEEFYKNLNMMKSSLETIRRLSRHYNLKNGCIVKFDRYATQSMTTFLEQFVIGKLALLQEELLCSNIKQDPDYLVDLIEQQNDKLSKRLPYTNIYCHKIKYLTLKNELKMTIGDLIGHLNDSGEKYVLLERNLPTRDRVSSTFLTIYNGDPDTLMVMRLNN